VPKSKTKYLSSFETGFSPVKPAANGILSGVESIEDEGGKVPTALRY